MPRHLPAGQGLWIRVNARDPHHPSVWRLAQRLKVDGVHAFGMLVAVWCGLAEHQKDGDVRALPESLLEQFAGWRGTPGAFASAFLELCVDADGIVEEWPAKMGKLLKDNEHAADRMRRLRESRRESTDNGRIPLDIVDNRNGSENSSRTVPVTDSEPLQASSRIPLRTVGGVGEGAPVPQAQGGAPSPRLVAIRNDDAEPRENGSRTIALPPSALRPEVLGQDPAFSLATYTERMVAGVSSFEVKRPADAAALRAEADLEAATALGGDAPAEVLAGNALRIYRAKVRQAARWPTYEEWVEIQRERSKAEAAHAAIGEGR